MQGSNAGACELRASRWVCGPIAQARQYPQIDAEGSIACALTQNRTSWPVATKGRPEPHIGYGAYHSLATAVAEQLRRSGIRFVKAPPARQHSVWAGMHVVFCG